MVAILLQVAWSLNSEKAPGKCMQYADRSRLMWRYRLDLELAPQSEIQTRLMEVKMCEAGAEGS